jgi:hypothetical protein
MKPASQITDRGKRYRANRNPPPGPRACNFCGKTKNVDVDHINGNEADDSPENKMHLCRSCNTSKGVVQKRANIGVRTRQYNPTAPPITTKTEWIHSAEVLLGLKRGDVRHHTERIRNTSPAKRASFTGAINPEPTFGQYKAAVQMHTRHAHDEGGKIIHATSPETRSMYARAIAEIKRQRRGEVPF